MARHIPIYCRETRVGSCRSSEGIVEMMHERNCPKIYNHAQKQAHNVNNVTSTNKKRISKRGRDEAIQGSRTRLGADHWFVSANECGSD